MSRDGIVACGTCRNWTPDTVAPESGVGTCKHGEHWMRTKSPYGAAHPPYPNAPRWCDYYQPKRN